MLPVSHGDYAMNTFSIIQLLLGSASSIKAIYDAATSNKSVVEEGENGVRIGE